MRPQEKARHGILHLMWWEGVLSSGLIENQAYEPLRRMAAAHPEYRWLLFSAGPFLKAGIRDRLLQYPRLARWIPNAHIRNRLDTDVLRADLRRHHIDLVLRETLFAPRTIYLRWPLQMTFPWFHLRRLADVIRRNNVRIVHCRSYSAAWVAFLARRLLRTPFRLVFDMRGLLPEEGILCGEYSRESRSFRRWKQIEKTLLDQSDLIIAPSDTFAEHIATQTANPRIRTLFTHSPVDIFMDTPADASWYEKHPVLKDRVVLAYLGWLGPRSWHSAEYLGRQFVALRKVMGRAALLWITRDDSEWVRQELLRTGVAPNELVLVASHSARQTAGLLKLARYGSLPYRAVASPEEKLLGHTMIASKTGEYLAAGLPLICHPGIGSAARMVRESGVGCLYDASAAPEQFEKDLVAVENAYAEIRKACIQTVPRFDVQRNAEICAQIYSGLAYR